MMAKLLGSDKISFHQPWFADQSLARLCASRRCPRMRCKDPDIFRGKRIGVAWSSAGRKRRCRLVERRIPVASRCAGYADSSDTWSVSRALRLLPPAVVPRSANWCIRVTKLCTLGQYTSERRIARFTTKVHTTATCILSCNHFPGNECRSVDPMISCTGII